MPTCRKCRKTFPILTEIEGKTRNLGNRKFCLDCSPFGSRNTKPDDPNRKSVYGQKNYKRVPYSDWDEQTKSLHRARTWQRGEDRKQRLIQMAGGSCCKCGYNKCSRSLSFHHRNPEKKSFSLDSRNIHAKKWKDLLKELEKCDLMCLNCHMELHAQEESIYRLILEPKIGPVGFEPTTEKL